jgi:Xaa-Pro aminopeptidase
MDIPALQRAIASQKLDGWLLYDFHGQNPTATGALGLGGHMLTRRWAYLVPAHGEPRLLVHAIEAGSFPDHVPGRRDSYASWQSFRAGLERMLADLPGRRLAMEYFPMAGIPYLSRVDAGTIELVRSLGVDVVSSGALVQEFLCRLDDRQIESHARACRAIDDAKDEAFARVGEEHLRGRAPAEHEIQAFLMSRFAEQGLLTDHPPIVAVNGHAGDPHYVPSAERPTPIRPGDLLLIDLWAKEPRADDPYADITWMAFCGDRAPPRVEEIFRVTADARDAGFRRVEEGFRSGTALQGWQVDRVVRDHIASKGWGDRFVHRTGHSIGFSSPHGDGANMDDLETHDTRELLPGTAFSIEPGIYVPEEGMGVRLEIDVVLAPGGPRIFSKLQQELVRIG